MDSLIDSNRLLQDTEEEQAGFGYLFRHNYPLFIAVMIGSSSFLAILMFTMRSWCYERYRRNCCPGALPESRRQQLWRERVAAEQRQRAMDQEVHEQSKATRREERRAWYNTYLKPFTMVCDADVVSLCIWCFFSNTRMLFLADSRGKGLLWRRLCRSLRQFFRLDRRGKGRCRGTTLHLSTAARKRWANTPSRSQLFHLHARLPCG